MCGYAFPVMPGVPDPFGGDRRRRRNDLPPRPGRVRTLVRSMRSWAVRLGLGEVPGTEP